MSINNRDDYDKLAKILYPSIEASGNVYFGQTRKLTMDEILGKNNLNFESHVESIQVEDNEKDFGYDYKSYFVWKLGPLYGSIRFNPVKNSEGYTFANFPDHTKFAIINEYEDETNFYYQLHITQNQDEIPGYVYDPLPEFWFDHYYIYGTVFAKYEIKFNDAVIHNEIISSGEYKSYSKNAYVEFNDLCVTNRANPTNALDKNIGDRHFYIDVKDGHYYLYIQICTSRWNANHTNKGNAYYFDADESYEVKWNENFRDPLTITAVEDSISVSLQKVGNVSANAWYNYKLDVGDWAFYDIDNPPSIPLNVGESVKFKGDIYKYNNAQTDYVRFLIYGNGKAKASGDIRSMCADHVKNGNTSYSAYQSLFYQCDKLLTAPKLPSTKLNSYCYYRTFAICTNLITAPRIIASQFYSNCCNKMFDSCSMLSKIYPINALSLGNSTNNKFDNLFDGCANINNVEFYLYDKGNINTDFSNDFGSWLSNGSESGLLTTNMNPNNIGDVPVGWGTLHIDFVPNDLITYSASANDIIEQGVIYKQDKLFTSGANSEDNGRGDLTSKDTLFKMLETNPLYNGGVSFDTYNKDGSFNQEIWGLKSFNSPVMFRNGIYGECSSLTTSEFYPSLTDKTFLSSVFKCQPSTNPEYNGNKPYSCVKDSHALYNSPNINESIYSSTVELSSYINQPNVGITDPQDVSIIYKYEGPEITSSNNVSLSTKHLANSASILDYKSIASNNIITNNSTVFAKSTEVKSTDGNYKKEYISSLSTCDYRVIDNVSYLMSSEITSRTSANTNSGQYENDSPTFSISASKSIKNETYSSQCHFSESFVKGNSDYHANDNISILSLGCRRYDGFEDISYPGPASSESTIELRSSRVGFTSTYPEQINSEIGLKADRIRINDNDLTTAIVSLNSKKPTSPFPGTYAAPVGSIVKLQVYSSQSTYYIHKGSLIIVDGSNCYLWDDNYSVDALLYTMQIFTSAVSISLQTTFPDGAKFVALSQTTTSSSVSYSDSYAFLAVRIS